MGLHRLIAILLLIESRGIVKARDLAAAFETSERTIYRDIETLCQSGIPIRSIPGPTGGFSFLEDYRLGMQKLTCDDVINLFLCGIGIRPEEYTENAVKLKNSILKLEKSLPEEYLPDIAKAKKRFYFDPTPWWTEIKPNIHLDAVRKALWQSKKIEIAYVAQNGACTVRIVRPYGLVVKDMEWYLIAYCETRNSIRGFNCNRIKSVCMTEDVYTIPTDFSLESYWHEWSERFRNEIISREGSSFAVKIRFKCGDIRFAGRTDVLEYIQEDGYTTALLELRNLENALCSLFHMCDEVEIVEPASFKQLVKSKAEAAARLNKD